MIKVPIKYTDFNDQEVEEDIYFNFTQDEMLEFIRKNRRSIGGRMAKAVKDDDWIEAYKVVRDLIIEAYGERSEDGRRFMKSADIRRNLTETPVLDTVIEEVMKDEKSANTFINSLIPPKMREIIEDRLVEEELRANKSN